MKKPIEVQVAEQESRLLDHFSWSGLSVEQLKSELRRVERDAAWLGSEFRLRSMAKWWSIERSVPEYSLRPPPPPLKMATAIEAGLTVDWTRTADLEMSVFGDHPRVNFFLTTLRQLHREGFVATRADWGDRPWSRALPTSRQWRLDLESDPWGELEAELALRRS